MVSEASEVARARAVLGGPGSGTELHDGRREELADELYDVLWNVVDRGPTFT